MTASLAAAASLALSITVLSFAQTLLATFSKPVSDQRESLLGFETLAVGARMSNSDLGSASVTIASFSSLPLGFLKTRRDSHWVTNLDVNTHEEDESSTYVTDDSKVTYLFIPLLDSEYVYILLRFIKTGGFMPQLIDCI